MEEAGGKTITEVMRVIDEWELTPQDISAAAV